MKLEDLDAGRAPRRLPLNALVFIVVPWLLAVALGMGLLLSYSFAPGRAAAAPREWPVASAVAHDSAHPNLVVVAHPRCACTRATLEELAWLMERVGPRVRATVLFVLPDGVSSRWEHTDLWDAAHRIEGVQVLEDRGGVQASHFGALTSGQAYLYDADRRLRFAGGITPTRGHVGDSVGRRRILTLVEGGAADRAVSEVYGCGLHDEDARDFVWARLRGLDHHRHDGEAR